MGRVLEHHAKEFLRERGIPVPRGAEAGTPAQAAAAAESFGGRVVVKALVPSNRRAKAGGIRFAADPNAAARAAGTLLGTEVSGREARSVLVEEHLELERELFFSVLVDKDRQLPVALASARGGIDIEETAGDYPEAIRTLSLDPWRPPLPHRLRELWASAGLSGSELAAAGALSHTAAALFFEADATILELNPIGFVRGRGDATAAIAVGVVFDIDDQALARQPRLAGRVQAGTDRSRPATELEQ